MSTPTPNERNKPTLVQKYGGSSLADPAALKRVAQAIVARVQGGANLVVVVSAMGGSTDALIALADQVSASPKRRELDMLLSTGERVTMALLSMAIADLGVEAISFTGSQCGIITNDVHTDARIIDVRPVRVEDELARGRVVIVAGFQGMSYKREITTLGRGGSDTTALALAAALGADCCEIYSDVAGVFRADPKVVSDAECLDRLGYGSMETLARNGAKVLQADAVAWARRCGIQFRARQTGQTSMGTLVNADTLAGPQAIASSRHRRFLADSSQAARFAKDLVHAFDHGLIIDSTNLHSELPGEACSTISVVGDDLLAQEDLLRVFLEAVGDQAPWWSTAHGLHARLAPDRDLDALTQQLHQRLFGV